MIEKVRLKITTVTPVAIGSGKELSPYADYVVDNEIVYFIDTKKSIAKIMAKGDQFFENYISGVANGIDNNRSLFDLRGFLLNNKIIRDINEVSSVHCHLIGEANSKLPIKAMIQSPVGEPYFPGSTIKGALKTALMYGYLKSNEDGEQIIENVLTRRNNLPNFDSLEKQFETFVDSNNRLIRSNTIQQVTDSTFLKQEAKVVVDCYRKMPIRLESIPSGMTAEFELTLEDCMWEYMVEQIYEYVRDSIDREFEIIDKQDGVDDYHNCLVGIEDQIAGADKNTAYIRLGFGKGYYFNSLGIAIYDYVMQKGKKKLKDKFEEFINDNFARGLGSKIKLEEFPKTRLYVTSTQQPLGWVKIEKV